MFGSPKVQSTIRWSICVEIDLRLSFYFSEG